MTKSQSSFIIGLLFLIWANVTDLGVIAEITFSFVGFVQSCIAIYQGFHE